MGKIKRVTVVIIFMMIATYATFLVPVVQAVGLEDDLVNNQQAGQSSGIFDDIKNQDIGGAEDIGDLLDRPALTSENLAKASDFATPIVNIVGYLVGFIIVVTCVLVSLFTAIDIFYISVPPLRKALYKSGTDGTGAYNGGFGMGSGQGGSKPTQWISDDAVACASLLGGSSQFQNNGMGMGMGMSDQKPVKVKSVLWMYIKRRSVFIVLLAVSILVLTSSAIMGTGVNIGQWALKVIMMLNGKMG